MSGLPHARQCRRSGRYIGLRLPEPVLSEQGALPDSTSDSVAGQVEQHESVSLAFLVLLEQLTPAERAVFLLREVFDYSYSEIAAIVEKDEAACRQIFSRARKQLAAQRPRFTATAEQHRRILGRFIQAVRTGGLDELIQLLTEDVMLWADGGGKVRGAATRPLQGRQAVARFVLASTRYLPAGVTVEVIEVNGQPAAILRTDTAALLLIALELDQAQVRGIRVIGNPEKLRRV